MIVSSIVFLLRTKREALFEIKMITRNCNYDWWYRHLYLHTSRNHVRCFDARFCTLQPGQAENNNIEIDHICITTLNPINKSYNFTILQHNSNKIIFDDKYIVLLTNPRIRWLDIVLNTTLNVTQQKFTIFKLALTTFHTHASNCQI